MCLKYSGTYGNRVTLPILTRLQVAVTHGRETVSILKILPRKRLCFLFPYAIIFAIVLRVGKKLVGTYLERAML